MRFFVKATELCFGEKVCRGRQTNEFIPKSNAQTDYFWKRPCAFHRENFDVYFGEE